MGHFAEISGSNNIVTRVIVVEQDVINSGDFGDSANWIKTSYNTYGGVHYGLDATGSYAPDSGSQLRKNFAGVGYTYNTGSDAFISPQPSSTQSLISACVNPLLVR